MKNKNNVEKYFKQKDFSVIEIILIVAALVFLAVAVFVRRGGPIGFPGVLVCAFLFCVFHSFKVGDSEIDQTLDKIKQDNKIEPSGDTIESYWLKDTVVKKRKDGKFVSPKYYITEVVFSEEETVFYVCMIDLLARSAEKASYKVDRSESIVISEETVKTSVGSARIACFATESGVSIPIVLNDYKTSELIEKVCERHQK